MAMNGGSGGNIFQRAGARLGGFLVSGAYLNSGGTGPKRVKAGKTTYGGGSSKPNKITGKRPKRNPKR